MSLEDLGNIGDFLGGIGVFLTLIYLALQVRQNTRSLEANTSVARAQTRVQLTSDAVESVRSVRTDDSMVEVLVKAASGEELNAKDQLLIDLWIRELFRSAEGSFYQHRIGAVDDEEFEGIYTFFKETFRSPNVKAFWSANKHQFPAAFASEVDEMIRDDA
jgi:hypothetical protein